ncbi:MAG: Trk system potassium transporter TrkA [Alphaproteobacteria bacterium]|nr:Trk system potassium transporter TrkA [Alphaproteobacteria bacterium]
MRIIIAGAGQVGVGLAKYLRAENHDIVLIDNNIDHLGNLSEQLDIQTIEGSSALPSVLEKAGAAQADIFLAVTGNDETNIVACGVADAIYRIPQRIVRISAHEYLVKKYKDYLIGQNLDVVLSPEEETARHVLDNLSISSGVDLYNLADGCARVVGLRCKKTSLMFSKTVPEIETLLKDIRAKVIAVKRRHRLVSLEKALVRASDDVYFVVAESDFQQFLDILSYQKIDPDCVMIFGGGKVGYQLAKLMESSHFCKNITIVEKDENRARYLAERLNSSVVIHGDGLDDSLIEDLNLKNYQIAIATTQSDESNVLLSMVSKRNNMDKTCALIHNQLYNDLLFEMGVDVSIDPNAVLVSSILQHIRKGKVKGDYFISSGVGEILEVEAIETAKITHKPIGKLKVPAGVMIAGIVRNGIFTLPAPDFQIESKDRVILFVERGHVKDAESLFTVGFNFF